MNSIYQIYDVEISRSATKKIEIVLETNSWQVALWEFSKLMLIKGNGRANLQLIEREYTGVLFVRMDVHIDGRPFCMSGETMGPDKFGYQ